MNHIKEGLELAKKVFLKSVLWDFIQQHHGNSLVYYFYRRALEGKEENQEVAEEGFRYPGPKPKHQRNRHCIISRFRRGGYAQLKGSYSGQD